MLDGSKQFFFSGGRETQPDATIFGWVPITIWKSHRIFACSFSISLGGVSHLDSWVYQTQPLYRCFCTLCQLPGYGILGHYCSVQGLFLWVPRISPCQPLLRCLGGTSHAGIWSPVRVPPGSSHLVSIVWDFHWALHPMGPSSWRILDRGCFILDSGSDAH